MWEMAGQRTVHARQTHSSRGSAGTRGNPAVRRELRSSVEAAEADMHACDLLRVVLQPRWRGSAA
jgi:hypothetical protein